MSAPTTNAASITYRLLITLRQLDAAGDETGATKRLAYPYDTIVASGSYAGMYYGKIIGEPSIDFDQGDEPFPRIIYSEFSFDIARNEADGDIDSLITWFRSNISNKIIAKVYFTDPGTCDTTDLVYQGYINAEEVEYTESFARVRCYDALREYCETMLPLRTLQDTDGSLDLDESLEDEPAPLIYGDWTRPKDAYKIPVKFVRTSDRQLKLGRVYDSAMSDGTDNGIESMTGPIKWRDAIGEPHQGGYWDYTDTAEEGRISLDDSESEAWSSGDEAYIRYIKGIKTATGLLIENPVLIIYDILLRIGVPLGSIDWTYSFFTTALELEGTKFRAYIDEEISAADLIDEICRDAGLRVYVDAGRIKCSVNDIYKLTNLDDPVTVKYYELIASATRHTPSPSKWNYEGGAIYYRRNPKSGKYSQLQRAYNPDGTDSKHTYYIESRWIYRDAEAHALEQRLETTMLADVEAIEMQAPNRGLGWELMDRILFSADGLSQAYHLYKVTKNYGSAIGTVYGVRAGDGLTRYGGEWTEDDAPTFAAATDPQKIDLGFWTDESGELAPDPDTTLYSVWE